MTRILLPGTYKATATRRKNMFLGKAPYGTGQAQRSGPADVQTAALIANRNKMRRAWKSTPIGSKGKL